MSNKPDWKVYSECQANGFYIKIGAAWNKQQDNGRAYISISLDALPIKGLLVLHPYDEETTNATVPRKEA